MFVVPHARAQRASVPPSFGRVIERLLDQSFDRHVGADNGVPTLTAVEKVRASATQRSLA